MNDPFSLARLEAEELSANPARLVEEAQTIPLFGGRRAVWAKAGSRNIAPAVEALLGLPVSECRVVIEAGDLRRFVNVYVGNDDVRFLDNLETQTPEGTQISVIPAVAGG